MAGMALRSETLDRLAGVTQAAMGGGRRLEGVARLAGGSRKGVYRLTIGDGTTAISYLWEDSEAGDGKALTLIFRADPGGPALATAILDLDGCGFTDLTVSAKYHSLGKYGSALSMATRVLQVAGVAWKLPPFQWPAA
jgi:hypothetical protein